MASRHRREYTDDDRAMVHLHLTLSTDEEHPQGNIARTSRETGIPEATIRDWRDQWEVEGVPPEVAALAAQEGKDFAEEAEKVRDQALRQLRKVIPDMKSGKELAVVIGVLTDKSMRARGLSTQKVEHVRTLPSPDEVRELMAAAAEGLTEQMAKRRAEIIDVVEDESRPIAELSPPRE